MAPTPFLTRMITSRVTDGDMSPASCEAASVHRARLFASANLSPEKSVFMTVPRPNGAAVTEVVQAAGGSTIIADALLTREPGLVLALLTADCLPVVISDEERGLLALAHCGWESTHLRLPRILLDRFCALGSVASRLNVRIGPAISAESYKRPREKVGQMHDPAWRPFLCEDEAGMVHIDVRAYVMSQFREGGVQDIALNPADTYRDTRYFSHRRAEEKKEPDGRMVTLAWLDDSSHARGKRVQ